jgi:hypothetical protein
MGDQVVSGRTRGEYGRGLDLSKITDIQGNTFVCPKTEHFMVLLQDEKKWVVNGEVVKEKPIFAEFRQHRFASKDEKLVELLRKSAPFLRGDIKELAQAVEESKAEKARRVQEMLDADPELREQVEALTKSKEGDTPEVEAPPKRTRKKT